MSLTKKIKKKFKIKKAEMEEFRAELAGREAETARAVGGKITRKKKYTKKFNKKYTKRGGDAARRETLGQLLQTTIEEQGDIPLVTFIIKHLYSKLRQNEKENFLFDLIIVLIIVSGTGEKEEILAFIINHLYSKLTPAKATEFLSDFKKPNEDASIETIIQNRGDLYVFTFIIDHLYSQLSPDELVPFLYGFQNLNENRDKLEEEELEKYKELFLPK